MANDKKTILARIKALFASEPGSSDASVTVVSYAVDAAQPVFVDISDDNLPDIDAGDLVYMDEAKSAPYPDGTYTVTGTDFSFTVVAGAVSAVSDPNGTGAGSPQAAAEPVTATVEPIAATVEPAASSQQPFSADEIVGKFSVGTPEERIANLEAMCKMLLESIKAQETQFQQAASGIALAANSVKPVQVMTERHEKILPDLFELVETLVNEPAGEPITLPENKKNSFLKAKEDRINNFAEHLHTIKNKAAHKA